MSEKTVRKKALAYFAAASVAKKASLVTFDTSFSSPLLLQQFEQRMRPPIRRTAITHGIAQNVIR